MVMRNRNNAEGSPGWWDDLPQKVRARFGNSFAGMLRGIDRSWVNESAAEPHSDPGRSPALDQLLEISRFALLFLAVGFVNIVVLFMALAYLDGRPPAILFPGH
jgi:hypothetical protein